MSLRALHKYYRYFWVRVEEKLFIDRDLAVTMLTNREVSEKYLITACVVCVISLQLTRLARHCIMVTTCRVCGGGVVTLSLRHSSS